MARCCCPLPAHCRRVRHRCLLLALAALPVGCISCHHFPPLNSGREPDDDGSPILPAGSRFGRPAGVHPVGFRSACPGSTAARARQPHRRPVSHRHDGTRTGRAGGRRRRAPGTVRQGHYRLPAHPGQSPGVDSRAPGTGADVFPEGTGRIGAAALRAGAGRRRTAGGGCQHPALSTRHADAQALHRLLRRRGGAGQQPQRRLGERDHLRRHRVRSAAFHPPGGFRRPIRSSASRYGAAASTSTP